jgi:hypothetical protein
MLLTMTILMAIREWQRLIARLAEKVEEPQKLFVLAKVCSVIP